jgi:hypothetical protein
MQKQTSLAHELRRGFAREASHEIVSDLTARLILHFWQDSDRVVVAPDKHRLCFRVLVDGTEVLEIFPSVTDKPLRPIGCMHKPNNTGAVVEAGEIEKGFDLAAEVIIAKLEEKDGDQ